MNRVIFFVDGFNLYHSLNDNSNYNKYKWLDIAKLSQCFITKKDQLEKILYFTSYTTWDLSKVARHKIYIRALQAVGIKIVLGEFKPRDKTCRKCGQTYSTFEEKRTDVNIAINLFQTAINDLFDTAIIVSGDSDLIPAIEAVKTTFPAKQIGVVIPIGRRAEALKNATDFHRKIREKHLASCQFPDVIYLDGNQKLERPLSWR
ncbi:MAG: NYN domain-containing protein [Nitrospinae bacterium]|nr:NYN domain-containing protein [Nitrospinota bacterium]